MYKLEMSLLARLIAETQAERLSWIIESSGAGRAIWHNRELRLTNFRREPYRLVIINRQNRRMLARIEGDPWGASQQVWSQLVSLSRLANPEFWAQEIDRIHLPIRPTIFPDPQAAEINRLLQM